MLINKFPLLKYCLLIITGIIILSSCGLLTLVVYHESIKPTETWYFSRGFEEDLDFKEVNTTISDSSNITNRAIQLVRNDSGCVKSYWVDFESVNNDNSEIRFRILDSNGVILRYLDAWLEPELSSEQDLNKAYFISDEKGNLIVKLDSVEYRIYHLGDALGKHHFDFVRPKNISQNSSLHNYWEHHGYYYTWLEYGGEREGFHLINQYTYEGEFLDSFYIILDSNEFSISENYFIQLDPAWKDPVGFIVNNGDKINFEIEREPFGGYGVDKRVPFINPVIHSFKSQAYIENIKKEISFGTSIKTLDFLRSKENLKVVNETIKSIGYSRFISKTEFMEDKYQIVDGALRESHHGYSLLDLSDSLLFYYNHEVAPKYFREFWERRKTEGIHDLVYEVLHDVKSHYSGGESEYHARMVNDTLQQIMKFDLKVQRAEDSELNFVINEYYNYLMEIGLNQSAYNLMFTNSFSNEYFTNKADVLDTLIEHKKPYYINGKPYFLTKNNAVWIE